MVEGKMCAGGVRDDLPPRKSFNKNSNNDFKCDNHDCLNLLYSSQDSGLTDKTSEIYCLLQENNPDIVIFNEINSKFHKKTR